MIKRYIKDTILDEMNYSRVILISGPRQSGKTTIAKEISNKYNMNYVTMDDMALRESAIKSPDRFLEIYAQKPLVIDEIQKAKELIEQIKIKVDNDNIKGQFILTGSADIMKIKEIEESLAGRGVDFTLYPISSVEFENGKINIVDIFFEHPKPLILKL